MSNIEFYEADTKIVYIQCPKCNDLVQLQELRECEDNKDIDWNIEDIEITCPYCYELSLWYSGMGWNEGNTLWQRLDLKSKPKISVERLKTIRDRDYSEIARQNKARLEAENNNNNEGGMTA